MNSSPFSAGFGTSTVWELYFIFLPEEKKKAKKKLVYNSLQFSNLGWHERKVEYHPGKEMMSPGTEAISWDSVVY